MFIPNTTKNLEVGIDEFTLILFPTDKIDCFEWTEKADIMINEFLDKSKLEEIYGKLVLAEIGKQKGYTTGWTIPNKPWYLMISINDDAPYMGICIRFSAHAYAVYKKDFEEAYNVAMNIVVFLKMVDSDTYKVRLSRIDLVADYKNYHDLIVPNDIYEDLKNKRLIVRDYRNRNLIRTKSALDKDGKFSTIYIGSRQANTRGFLRIYDKRLEQIQKQGFRYDEAISCESWIRFEAVYKGKYAHQLTDEFLTNIHSPVDLQSFIAGKIAEKYRFYDLDTKDETVYTKDLLALIGNTTFNALRNESPRDNALFSSIQYLKKGSGLFPTLYKVYEIWGKDADTKLIQLIFEEYAETFRDNGEARKNRDIILWLKKHRTTLVKETLEDYYNRGNFFSPAVSATTDD